MVPCAIGLFFALWALRGVSCGIPLLSDSARHAMNGVLIHDYVKSAPLTDPTAFAQEYYSRLPGFSLPYHPPLFPCVEALCYCIFGVDLFAARFAVALAVFACAVLLFRLVETTHGSLALAALTTVAFLCLTSTRLLSCDVMLEMPALAFTLGALYCLRELPDRYSLAQGLGFALLAEAAVWTKQHTAFLGLVPFLCVAVTRRWRLLAEKTIWISSALFGCLLLPLLHVSARPSYGSAYGSDLPVSLERAYEIIFHHVKFYPTVLYAEFGLLASLFIVGSVVVLLVGQFRLPASPADALYLAWALASAVFVTLIAGWDQRYLFFVYPALVFLGCVGLARLSNAVAGRRWTWLLPSAVTLFLLVQFLQAPPCTIFGPGQAAEYVLGQSAKRILYCGKSDGSFIFAARALSASPQLTVLRGDKLPPETFATEAFLAFLRRNRIEYVVLEHTTIPNPWLPQSWLALEESPPPSLVLEREWPVLCQPYRLINGRLRIYRVTDPLRISALPWQVPEPGIARS